MPSFSEIIELRGGGMGILVGKGVFTILVAIGETSPVVGEGVLEGATGCTGVRGFSH